MAFIQLNFRSQVLMQNTNVNVILPDNTEPPFKTLYLLHGLYGDYSAWIRNTSIEQYIKTYNIAAVMPSAENSFYTDMKFGGRYYTYISNEIVEYTRKTQIIFNKSLNIYCRSQNIADRKTKSPRCFTHRGLKSSFNYIFSHYMKTILDYINDTAESSLPNS